MKNTIVLIISLLAFALPASWNATAEFESAMANALQNDDLLISTAFTNDLQRFISSPLSPDLKPIAELVSSVGYLTLADQEALDTLPQAFQCASNSIAHSTTSSWTFWAAHLQLFACHQIDNNPRKAYDVMSNLVERAEFANFPGTTNCVAMAFLRNARATNLTFRQAFVYARALGAAQNAKDSEARSLCGSLPAFCAHEIEGIITSR